ncbi:MAG: hypothetical protein AB1567_01855 [bacterium]
MKIEKSYKQWIDEENRRTSGEIDYGVWWGLYERSFPWWRVSWIRETGELYTVNLSNLDEFIILGNFTTEEEVERRMDRYCKPFDNMVITRWFASELSHKED